MALDSSASQTATNALQAIPFGTIIGGPLKACIEAQALAAQTTWEFIQNVGLNIDPETKEKKAVNVTFQFIQNGEMVQLNVPLLTIVPIPYIAINTVDISFKANITASASSKDESEEHSSSDKKASFSAGYKGWGAHVNSNMNASVSSKKDSKSTQDSKYSVEYTMDVNVKAGQDSMPAGMSKILEILGNSLQVTKPTVEIEVNAHRLLLDNGKAILTVTYKNQEGLFDSDKVTINEAIDKTRTVEGNKVFYTLEKADNYTVKVKDNDKLQTIVTVMASETAPKEVTAPQQVKPKIN